VIAAHRFEIAPPPLAIDVGGQDLTSGSTTWTALPDVGETTFSAADSRRELDYMHARYRSPLTSRFLSTDPAGWDPSTPQSWNRYAYVMGNPLRNADLDGRSATDVLRTVPLVLPSLAGLGALGGSVIAGPPLVVGGVIGGLSGATAYGLMSIPGWNEAMTFPAATDTLSNLIVWASNSDDTSAQPKLGSSGGPGAGKDFGEKVKNAEREASGNTCRLCGTETGRKAGPNQSNIDHAQPKSRGGNNSQDNAQNTCRTCNLKKGTKTTEEVLRDRQNGGGSQ
jgi:RHS repeat-associated protein